MEFRDLSIREKVLQTIVLWVHNSKEFKFLKAGGIFVGGTIISDANDSDLESERIRINKYIENSDIPPLIVSDFESGCGEMFKGLTTFPLEMSLGATQCEELAYEYGKATAMEAKEVYANWSFSPVADLNLNPWNQLVGERSLGDNPDEASRMIKALIKGMQDNGLAACAKHFPGDGVDWRDQHRVTTYNTLSMDDWRRLTGRVFKEAIDGGVYSIMVGHIGLPAYQKERIEGIAPPATISYELITKLLKEELGFKGVVVTDALGMGGILGWNDSTVELRIDCFKAGCDMMLGADERYVDRLVEAVENGEVSMERLDDAVNRIFEMKRKLGLFDKNNDKRLSFDEKEYVKNVGDRVAEKSITLLRDTKNIFPLNPEKKKKIAIVPIIKDDNYERVRGESELLCKEFEKRGFEVDCYDRMITGTPFRNKLVNGNPMDTDLSSDEIMNSYDAIIYAMFTRVFRPSGPEDFSGEECLPIKIALSYARDKSIVVSFGSPYLIGEYFDRAYACVNAYSMVSSSVKAFVRAAVGEIEFSKYSPVNLEFPKWTPQNI